MTELCLDTTLRCGQSFRWRKSDLHDEWSCALQGRIVSVKQDVNFLHYRSIWPGHELEQDEHKDDNTEDLIYSYFNLGPNLESLYQQWSKADANFQRRAPKFTGIRILRQDPWEALVGFICSSNNNIVRISQMVQKLCMHYGPLLGRIEDNDIHDFPAPEALAGPDVESHLRQLGFGYRARYLAQTVNIILNERPPAWLHGLRAQVSDIDTKSETDWEEGRSGYRQAHDALLYLQGVGPKVADCVCLMGLGWGEAVPVDTHVWQIAQRDYKFGKGKHRSLTKATYDAVANHFRSLWGNEAGWAHSVLFAADLKTFAARLAPVNATAMAQSIAQEQQETLLVDRRVIIKREHVEDVLETVSPEIYDMKPTGRPKRKSVKRE